MNNKIRKVSASLLFLLLTVMCHAQTFHLADYGLAPNSGQNASRQMEQALAKIRMQLKPGKKATLKLAAGRYDFYPEGAATREYYISNHDQPNPKHVGIELEGMDGITLDGGGAEFIFHGQMLPVALVNSHNCTLKNFSVDFDNPHIAQATIVSNDAEAGVIVYELAEWVRYEVRDSTLYTLGDGWRYQPQMCIAFEGKTRRLVYNTSDTQVKSTGIYEAAPRQITAHGWKNPKLVPGTVLALRTWNRPAPGIFMADDTNTTLRNLKIHYAEGMGLLAQMCENITLDGFNVCLRGTNDPRYFTTQADATHFSGCKGNIISRNGLYESMMDDAINIHGTYLKIIKKVDDCQVIARYMHDQSYGFRWGEAGDSVQFIHPQTMELADGGYNRIAAIDSVYPINKGVREFAITFEKPLDKTIDVGMGIENLTWTPEVLFEKNVVRNNRARGSLFSTPRRTVVRRNLFDHTSGTAVLLCGDCNGWYETGACRNVRIERNHFVNSLTNQFQFTNAVISICPEIPNLQAQRKYFHSGIVIENNEFETFDRPILYAKSVDGLTFKHNNIRQNSAYHAFHWNTHRFLLERVVHFEQENNTFSDGFDASRDLLSKP